MNANELPADQLADLLDEIPVGDFESLDHHHFTRQAATMLRQQQEEIEYWKDEFNKAMKIQEIKPAKYSDEWWKEAEEFNKKAQEK
jgi:hypothetical protein